MILGSGRHTGPAYLCDRCEWAPELCTCRITTGRAARRPRDWVDLEHRANRRFTLLRNKHLDPRTRRRLLAAS